MAEARIFISRIVIYHYLTVRQSPLSVMAARVMHAETGDSGCKVIIPVFTKVLSRGRRAEEQGFEVFTTLDAAKRADIIMILINDEKQALSYIRNQSDQILNRFQYV